MSVDPHEYLATSNCNLLVSDYRFFLDFTRWICNVSPQAKHTSPILG